MFILMSWKSVLCRRGITPCGWIPTVLGRAIAAPDSPLYSSQGALGSCLLVLQIKLVKIKLGGCLQLLAKTLPAAGLPTFPDSMFFSDPCSFFSPISFRCQSKPVRAAPDTLGLLMCSLKLYLTLYPLLPCCC